MGNDYSNPTCPRPLLRLVRCPKDAVANARSVGLPEEERLALRLKGYNMGLGFQDLAFGVQGFRASGGLG